MGAIARPFVRREDRREHRVRKNTISTPIQRVGAAAASSVLHARLPACPTFLPGTRAFPPHPVVICDQFRLPPEVYAAARIPPSLTLVTVVYRCSRQNAAFSGAPAQTSLHHLFIPEKSKSEAASTVLEIESAARRARLRNLLSTIVLPSPLFSRQVLHA